MVEEFIGLKYPTWNDKRDRSALTIEELRDRIYKQELRPFTDIMKLSSVYPCSRLIHWPNNQQLWPECERFLKLFYHEVDNS